MSRKFRDDADWNGIELISTKVGTGGKHERNPEVLEFGGYRYASPEERMLAELLSASGIAFTPDVSFGLDTLHQKERIFVPDFIFDRQAYIWSGQRADRRSNAPSVLIHGIEAKGMNGKGEFSARAKENVALLWQTRRIKVLLLANEDIHRYYAEGSLPLRPFNP